VRIRLDSSDDDDDDDDDERRLLDALRSRDLRGRRAGRGGDWGAFDAFVEYELVKAGLAMPAPKEAFLFIKILPAN
jgi:hypothetical protein